MEHTTIESVFSFIDNTPIKTIDILELKSRIDDMVQGVIKETAEKILIKSKQLVEKWLSRNDEKVGFLYDFESFIGKQFSVDIKE